MKLKVFDFPTSAENISRVLFENIKKIGLPVVEVYLKETTSDIKKEINRGHIIKTIAVNDKGSQHRYQEKVRLLFPEDFEAYFQENDLKVVHVFGGYDLKPFEKFSSQRMIFVGDKSI